MDVNTLKNIAIKNILQNTTVYVVTYLNIGYHLEYYAETVGVTFTLDDAKILMVQEYKKSIYFEELVEEYLSEEFNKEEIKTLISNNCLWDDDFCLNKMDKTTKLRFLKALNVKWGEKQIIRDTGGGYDVYNIDEMKFYIADSNLKKNDSKDDLWLMTEFREI